MSGSPPGGPSFPSGRSLIGGNKPLRVAVTGGRSLARKHPLVAKALPTACGFLFGDVLTQFMNHKAKGKPHGVQHQQQQPFQYDYSRGAKMWAVGAFVAAPLLYGVWRGFDLTLAQPNSLGANSLKFTVDQVIGCAMWQAAYCAIHPPYRQALTQVLAATAAGVEQHSAVVRRALQQPAALA